jgi:NAD(P)-dependent dehydrogenase (short-subunit alcohol dehydrogenase family)
MDLGLTGRSVAVLGAGSGPGRATALAFAEEGAVVTVFGRRTGPLEAVAREAGITLGRYGSPQEFARAAVFHCPAANTYVTGQLVLADGGAYQG